MDLGRHVLTVDDELVPRATDAHLGDLVLSDDLLLHRDLNLQGLSRQLELILGAGRIVYLPVFDGRCSVDLTTLNLEGSRVKAKAALVIQYLFVPFGRTMVACLPSLKLL